MEVYQSAQTTQLERETQPQGGLRVRCERLWRVDRLVQIRKTIFGYYSIICGYKIIM